MNILVFKTDLKTKKKVREISPCLNNHALIQEWSVDLFDVDNVLRIVTSHPLKEGDVISLVKQYGFYCKPL